MPAADPTGTVAGFADATGRFLPLVVHAERRPGARRDRARCSASTSTELSELALSRAAPAPAGWSLVPYLEGERTPNRPDATGAAARAARWPTPTPAHLARAAVEGMLCGLADGLDALVAQGAPVERVLLVGGGARSEARARGIAPAVLGRPVLVPPPGEYVADGAARQAAWVLAGGDEPPAWPLAGTRDYEADPMPRGPRALRRGPRPHRLPPQLAPALECRTAGSGHDR